MMRIERGIRRTARPDLFLSHSAKDRKLAAQLATTLNFCGVDVWLDQWELQIGQSLMDEISKAMDQARYIAILITANYNKTVWTKTEYKKALAREQKEGRNVMLPLLMGDAELPDYLEEKIYVDLRSDYYSGITRLACMMRDVSEFRVSRKIEAAPPQNIRDVWDLLEALGFDWYVVLGHDDFDEILKNGGELTGENRAHFYPDLLLASPAVSAHVKDLIRELT